MFVVQEYLLGEWSDFVADSDRATIDKLYEKVRCQTPRRVRLIERVETVLSIDNKHVDNEYAQVIDKQAEKARCYGRPVLKEV